MAQPYQVVVTDRAKESLRKIIKQVHKRASTEVAQKVKDGLMNLIICPLKIAFFKVLMMNI